MIAFTIPAFAYVPSTHLVFHSLWQVGMSLGTVMTDSLCLPKVRLEKTTLAALLCSKKKKTDWTCPILWGPQWILRGATNHLSTWYEHPIRQSSSDRLPPLWIYLYASHERRRPCDLFVMCHTSSGNLKWAEPQGRITVSLLYIYDKVRSRGRDIVLWKIFDNIWKSQTMKLWTKVKKIFFRGRAWLVFFTA